MLTTWETEYEAYGNSLGSSQFFSKPKTTLKFPGGSDSKESAYRGDLGLIPGLGRSPGAEDMATHSSILAWKIPMDRGAWWATVQRGLQKVGHD